MTGTPGSALRRAWTQPGRGAWIVALATGVLFALSRSLSIASSMWQEYPEGMFAASATIVAHWVVLFAVFAALLRAGTTLLPAVAAGRLPGLHGHVGFVLACTAAVSLLVEPFAYVLMRSFHEASWPVQPFWAGRSHLQALVHLWTITIPPLLLFGACGVCIEVLHRRARRSALALSSAQLQLAAVRANLYAAELQREQANVDPTYLFDTLAAVEADFERAPDAARRLLDALIRYLRAAMPGIDDVGSTLGAQADLAAAYLAIECQRSGGRLSCQVDVPADIAPRPFAPLLLLPLVMWIVPPSQPLPPAGEVSVQARLEAGRLVVSVRRQGDELRVAEPARLAELRRRLARLYGERASLEEAGAAARIAIALEGGAFA